MIKPAPSEWTGPLEAITMRHGDCKSYSLSKYAGAQELGISADQVRLVIVHNRRHSEDHVVTAVHQDGEWFILDNLTNVLSRDWEKRDYEPLAVWVTWGRGAIFRHSGLIDLIPISELCRY